MVYKHSFRQCICKIYTSPAVDPKSIKGITEPAKDLCAWTNAICALIEEIDYSLRNKEKIHDLYTNAEIDLAAIIAEDGLSQTPEERYALSILVTRILCL